MIIAITLLADALYLSPLGAIGPCDAVAIRATWVQQQARFGPWTADPPAESGKQETVHRSGTIDVQWYTITFTDWADPTDLQPHTTRIDDVRTHYLWLVPLVAAWTGVVVGLAWAWQRACRKVLARWLAK